MFYWTGGELDQEQFNRFTTMGNIPVGRNTDITASAQYFDGDYSRLIDLSVGAARDYGQLEVCLRAAEYENRVDRDENGMGVRIRIMRFGGKKKEEEW